MMKKGLFSLLLVVLAFLLPYCSQGKKAEGEIVARINDYSLTLGELRKQLAAEMELNKDFKLTREARMDFLEGLIRKELLIQEARRHDLDKKEKFVRAMERYWESTLIRDLMEMKGEDIGQEILISQEEIRNQYEAMKESGEKLASLPELDPIIKEDLKEKKKTRELKEWINDLRQRAKIEVDQELLFKE